MIPTGTNTQNGNLKEIWMERMVEKPSKFLAAAKDWAGLGDDEATFNPYWSCERAAHLSAQGILDQVLVNHPRADVNILS